MGKAHFTRAGVSVEVHLNLDGARNAVYDAALDAIRETFEDNILPDAKQNSPVGELPERPGSKHNRESLETKVFGTKKGPFAKIYSTSGHGGFLEVGTKKMSAQPYIWPAFQKNLGRLVENIRQKIQAAEVDGKKAADVGRAALPGETQ
jgi:HK97 gp10 family phage protein